MDIEVKNLGKRTLLGSRRDSEQRPWGSNRRRTARPRRTGSQQVCPHEHPPSVCLYIRQHTQAHLFVFLIAFQPCHNIAPANKKLYFFISIVYIGSLLDKTKQEPSPSKRKNPGGRGGGGGGGKQKCLLQPPLRIRRQISCVLINRRSLKPSSSTSGKSIQFTSDAISASIRWLPMVTGCGSRSGTYICLSIAETREVGRAEKRQNPKI